MHKLSLHLVIVSLCATVGLAASPSPAAILGADAADLLIPVAGRTEGFGGELFVTDLTLVNFSASTQNVSLTWLPQGGTSDPQTVTVEIPAYGVETVEDVVATSFDAVGVGAIRIRGVDAAGAFDSDSEIDAFARIFTETTCAGLTGTVSQSLPAIVIGDAWRSGSGAYAHGVRQTAQYRTNYGIVNPNAFPMTFQVVVRTAGARFDDGVTVPAHGMVHRPAPAGATGELSVYVDPVDPDASSLWRAYASTVDNRTGSGWTVVAIQPRVDPVFED
jgi:hypothetical protein